MLFYIFNELFFYKTTWNFWRRICDISIILRLFYVIFSLCKFIAQAGMDPVVGWFWPVGYTFDSSKWFCSLFSGKSAFNRTVPPTMFISFLLFVIEVHFIELERKSTDNIYNTFWYFHKQTPDDVGSHITLLKLIAQFYFREQRKKTETEPKKKLCFLGRALFTCI